MTEQEQKAFDQMREALKPELVRQWGELKTMFMGNGDSHEVVVITLARLRHLFDAALTAANAVSHPKPETAPPPEGGAITSESAANAVSDHIPAVGEMVQPRGLFVDLIASHGPDFVAEMAAIEPVGINGLTEAETSASMSVMGLSKPTVRGALDKVNSQIAAATEENFGRCPNEKWFSDLIDRRDALEYQLKTEAKK